MKNIKFLSRLLQAFICLAALSMSGCNGSKLEQLDIELKTTNEKIKEIKMELERTSEQLALNQFKNMKLSDEVEKLQRNIQKLNIEKQLLKTRHDELKEWSIKIVDGYGPGIWYIDESTLPAFVKPMKSADVKEIVEALNKRFETDHLPKVILKKVDSNRVTIGVEDEDLLTQRMGSHGAASYMNSVTYSIASVKGIDCVRFEFREGDHAKPGEYCR